MCYSAKVEQDLRGLSKRYRADIAWEDFDELYRRRLELNDVKVARGLERNFARPTTDLERQTKSYIDQYAAQVTAKWETEVFAQRKRGGAAEESLRTKETKSARENVRIATKKIESLLERLADLKRSEPGKDDGRIFPMMYAPVLVQEDGRTLIRPMRYTCRLAGKPADYDVRYPGTYNARRDSLSGFWNNVYGRNHAVMVVSGFFENVPRHLYEHRELGPGEQPQNVVLEFDPRPAAEMLVACVWDRWRDRSGNDLYSFAAVTDEPPEEVAATGHQRCVVALREQNLHEWLAPASISRDRLDAILSDRECLVYEHQIAA
jgi:putative SOS response-associated peptidase YedK